jgi:hypothetical protein
MLSKARSIGLAGVVLLAMVSPAMAQLPGSNAPMHVSVGEDMQLVDLAEFIDGTPLVFVYGSAT